MVQQVLLTHYSRVFPSQYLLMHSLHLPTTRVWSLPKTPRHRAVAPQQCPGAIAPILAQSRDGPFLPESAEDSLHQAPRTEVTTHTLLPRFHTWRGNPDVLTRVGSFHGRGPTPPLVGLGLWLLPTLRLLFDDPQREFMGKAKVCTTGFLGLSRYKILLLVVGLGSSFQVPWQVQTGWAGGRGCSLLGLCSGSQPSEVCPARSPLFVVAQVGDGNHWRLEQGFWVVNYFSHLQNLGARNFPSGHVTDGL